MNGRRANEKHQKSMHLVMKRRPPARVCRVAHPGTERWDRLADRKAKVRTTIGRGRERERREASNADADTEQSCMTEPDGVRPREQKVMPEEQ